MNEQSKNNKQLMLAAIGMMVMVAIGLNGCSASEYAFAPTDGKQQVAVNFGTRSTTQGTGFYTGDQVNLITGSESNIFTLNSEGAWLTAGGKNYLAPTLPATLTAVYPGTSTAAGFTLPVDQSASDGNTLRTADYKTSTLKTLTAFPIGAIGFELEHRLCKISVAITQYDPGFGGTLPNISDIKITSKGSGITLSFAADGTTVVTTTGNATDVVPFVTTGENNNGLNKYEAIITPGTYSATSKLMTLSVNGIPMNVPLSGETTLVSGKTYRYTLTINKRELVLSPEGTIPGWKDDETEL